MVIISRRLWLWLGLLLVLVAPAGAQCAHHPTPSSDVRIDSMDIFWRRADQKYIRFTFHIFNTSVQNLAGTLNVRVYVRASPKEDWRPIKVWRVENLGGHEMRELVYKPGVIADPVIYTGRFQLRVDLDYRDQVVDTQQQDYP